MVNENAVNSRLMCSFAKVTFMLRLKSDLTRKGRMVMITITFTEEIILWTVCFFYWMALSSFFGQDSIVAQHLWEIVVKLLPYLQNVFKQTLDPQKGISNFINTEVNINTRFYDHFCAATERMLKVEPNQTLINQRLGFGSDAWNVTLLRHGSAKSLKIDYGVEINNCSLCPPRILWHQIFHALD